MDDAVLVGYTALQSRFGHLKVLVSLFGDLPQVSPRLLDSRWERIMFSSATLDNEPRKIGNVLAYIDRKNLRQQRKGRYRTVCPQAEGKPGSIICVYNQQHTCGLSGLPCNLQKTDGDLWKQAGEDCLSESKADLVGMLSRYRLIREHLVEKKPGFGSKLWDGRFLLQDVFLSDSALKSSAGAVQRKNFGEVLDFAAKLDLISSPLVSVRLRDGGRILKLLSDAGRPVEPNPFSLSAQERVFFLSRVIQFDGMLFARLVHSIISLGIDEFDRGDGGLRREFLMMLSDLVKLARSTSLRNELRDLLNKVQKGERPQVGEGGAKERSTQTPARASVGTIEHRLTPRLEQLGDLCFLDKPDGMRDKFRYRTTTALRRLDDALTSFNVGRDGIERFVRAQYFSFAVKAFGLGAVRTQDPDRIWPYVGQSYPHFRFPVGETPIFHFAFAASLLALGAESIFFEVEDVIAMLAEEFKRNPEAVSLAPGKSDMEWTFARISEDYLRQYLK